MIEGLLLFILAIASFVAVCVIFSIIAIVQHYIVGDSK